ncbi:hypothetical protein V1525DRAFT_434357 [Lipomyces kononenkoae]|uniref:Uncharacterized protein n=1 Tax=Lipomyces kononenkoae TaxID=34357 RepID=A0ACC3SVX6_LIPKO
MSCGTIAQAFLRRFSGNAVCQFSRPAWQIVRSVPISFTHDHRTYTSVFHKVDSDFADEEITTARTWLNTFKVSDIPRDKFHISFARSGGPGGQNVNKLNTKATIKCSWEDLDWIPQVILERLRTKHFRYLTKHDNVVVQSDSARQRHDNLEDCFQKLHDMIHDCAFIPDEATPEKVEKWNEIKTRSNEARLAAKKRNGEKKRLKRTAAQW